MARDGNGVEYVPGAAQKVYMATLAHTEEAAVATLTERAAAFYGLDPERIGVTLTSVEQEESESFSICDTEPVAGALQFSVEGYGYIRWQGW